MKKNFVVVWSVCFILFNAITFLVPNEVFGLTRFDKPVFWISYSFVNIVLIAFLFIAIKFLKGEKADNKFLSIPLISTAYVGLIVVVIIGSIFMALPILPVWLSAIICILVAGYFIIACVKAESAKNIVEKIEENVKQKTQFIKMAILDAESIYNRASIEDTKSTVKKVYEALKYSDPMSCSALEGIESEIAIMLRKLKDVVMKNEQNIVNDVVAELLILIRERNSKCKALK